MKTYLSKVPSTVWLLLLATVTVLAHLPAIPIGLLYHDSDLTIPLLASDHFIRGDISAFYFQQEYGGTVFTMLRALWVAVFQAFASSRDDYINAQMLFSYLVGPVLAAWLSYICAKKYCSPSGALVVGLFSAISVQGMVQHCGDDFYYAFFIAAPLMLIAASKGQSIFWSYRYSLLLLASAASGFMFYTFRGSLIYIVVMFLPVTFLFSELKRIFEKSDRVEKTLIYLIIFLLCFYLYLDFFGPVIGIYNGRPVKLQAEPNLTLATIAFVFLLIKIHYRDIDLTFLKRTGITFLGFAAGLSPEIFHRINHKEAVSLQNWQVNTFVGALDVLANRVAIAVRQIILGHEEFNVYQGFLKNAPLLLVAFGVYYLIKTAKTNKKVLPLIFAGTLSLAAYFRVHMSGPGHYRYLIPLLPIIALSVGIFWDQTRAKGKTFSVAAAVLISLAFSYQYIQRIEIRENVLKRNAFADFYAVVDHFKTKPVSVVISDEFYHSNQYTFISRENPYFVSVGRMWGPEKGFEQAIKEKIVGILLTGKTKPSSNNEIIFFGRNFKLSDHHKIGEKDLYIGTEVF